MTDRAVKLHGRIFLSANIELLTGLHIGGNAGGLEIGGVDKPVIRNPNNNQPYIPCSSLKGKLRSLMEKAYAAPQTFRINEGVFVHIAESQEEYDKYKVCGIFGTLPKQGSFSVTSPTRLVVRDVPLEAKSAGELKNIITDLPYTEVKWEAAIDRVTSAAAPRQIERVPAGAIFGSAEFIFSVYSHPEELGGTVAMLFAHVIEALEYLEDDYLGGMGTRGNGRVRLHLNTLRARRITANGYSEVQPYALDGKQAGTIDRDDLKRWLSD